MAECVSCGKDIAEGELFCRDCLARMKGRGPRLEGEQRTNVGSAGAGTTTRGASSPLRRGETLEGQKIKEGPSESRQIRRARGELTPAQEKKVISLRPGMEEGRRPERRAFRVTITLSDRGYRLLARLGLTKREEGRGEKDDRERKKVAYLRPLPGGRVARVTKSPPPGGEEGGKIGPWAGLKAYFLPRRRVWDRADKVSALVIMAASLLSLTLFPFSWIRVEWLLAGEATPQVVGVKGYQLGTWSYLVLGLALIELLYLLSWFVLRRPPLSLDFGALSLIAGFLAIAFFNLSLSSNSRILMVAARATGVDPLILSGPQAALSRHTLVPAYLVLICLIAIPLAGLARLSRRD